MEIIDGQLHEFGPRLDWSDADEHTKERVLAEAAYAAMAAAGVDGAVLHPVGDIDWACRLADHDPDRFVVVPMLTGTDILGAKDLIHPDDPELDERISEVTARPSVAALRGIEDLPSQASPAAGVRREGPRFEQGGFDRAFKICQERGIPVFLNVSGSLNVVGLIADAFPGLTIIVDHMGVPGPPREPDDPWWKRIPEVIDLAKHPNINLKLSGAPVFSRQQAPFEDVRPHVVRLVEGFGSSRLMWGSDITRFQGRIGWRLRLPALEGSYPGRHTYAESVAFVRDAAWLTDGDKEQVLGGTARRLLHWPPTARTRA